MCRCSRGGWLHAPRTSPNEGPWGDACPSSRLTLRHAPAARCRRCRSAARFRPQAYPASSQAPCVRDFSYTGQGVGGGGGALIMLRRDGGSHRAVFPWGSEIRGLGSRTRETGESIRSRLHGCVACACSRRLSRPNLATDLGRVIPGDPNGSAQNNSKGRIDVYQPRRRARRRQHWRETA